MIIHRHQEIPRILYNEPAPKNSATKTFLTTSGSVTIAGTVNKNVYLPGEDIHVSCNVHNKSNREIKKLKVNITRKIIA